MAGTQGASAPAVVTLDPYQCVPKKNRKYASECAEVHLSNLGAEAISENFAHFDSVESVWFSGNRLSFIDNLDMTRRIREIYLQDNRLVSLNGIRHLKFLRVLLASGNQLRNLEKQLIVLTKFGFLNKLDLFDNPCAEEPDYRLRIIYHMPQVETLDRRCVKGPERLRADDVVPKMDQVAAAKPEGKKRVPVWLDHSPLEHSCFRTAGRIATQRRRAEDLALTMSAAQFGQTCVDLSGLPPEARVIRENRERFEGHKAVLRHRSTGTLDTGTSPADVLAAACADADQWSHTKTFSASLGRHMAKPGTKVRGDVFHQSFLVPRREIDVDTGKQSIRVAHEPKFTPLTG